MLPGAFARVAFVALAATACHRTSSTAPPRPATRSAGQRDEITRKDIQPLLSELSSAYDIVKRLLYKGGAEWHQEVVVRRVGGDRVLANLRGHTAQQKSGG